MDAKTANRCWYDRLGPRYERVDGRRTPALQDWLRGRLRALLDRVPPPQHVAAGAVRVLDLGAGGGWVGRAWHGLGVEAIGLDLSPAMAGAARAQYSLSLAGDVDHLPVVDGAMAVVTAFATLHHLGDFAAMAREVARVLVPGGWFYSDHDLDGRFSRRYQGLLRCYRFVAGGLRRRQYAAGEAEMEDAAECHAAGLPTEMVAEALRGAGLQVTLECHGYGLAPWADWWWGDRAWPAGRAPLVAIRAQKTCAPAPEIGQAGGGGDREAEGSPARRFSGPGVSPMRSHVTAHIRRGTGS